MTRAAPATEAAGAPSVEERLLSLERALEEARTEQTNVPPDLALRLADLGQQVEQVAENLRALHGRVDSLEARPPEPPAAPAPELLTLRERVAELAAQMARLETRAAAPTPEPRATQPPPPTAPPAAPPATAPPTPNRPAAAPQELYDRAYGLHREGRYEEAREAFRDYVRLHPDTPLTDNAHFWIGESYYDQRQFENAILEYDKVVQKYPEGDKVASALLKQAFAFDAIGDPVDARILLKKILRDHPSTEQAAIARKKLEILGE